MLFSQFAEAIKEDQSAWEDLKERIVQAQKDLDSNITPDDLSALQKQADKLEQEETGVSAENDENNEEDDV